MVFEVEGVKERSVSELGGERACGMCVCVVVREGKRML